MTEEPPPPPLAERALSRLRKIAAGNGLEPAAIVVLEKQEQDLVLGGKMEMSPSCTMESTSYPGGVRGSERKTLNNLTALQEAVAAHQKTFRESPDWVAAAVKEIKSHESQGWGLEDAKVVLSEKSAIYAATEPCPQCGGRKLMTCGQCNGQGNVICAQCHGQGREPCHYCAGRGENPQQPGQHCPTCNGARVMPCRFCQMRGRLACPTCNGKGGNPCPGCKGNGSITQEVAVTCGAETHFRLVAENLPSGLRRGIERIGVANLGKGHADITTSPPTAEELETRREGGRIPVLNYRVLIPYAELRMGLGSKKAVIAAVGKRCAISGVPHFLDASLQPWRDKLHQAATGKASLEDAIEARALHETLSLTVSGNGRIEELRRLYPFGLSTDAMTSLLADMQAALHRTTLKIRAATALLCAAICAALFYGCFRVGFEARVTLGWKPYIGLAADGAILIAALAASWATLNFSTRFVLKRRFPNLALALQQEIGKIGYGMLAGIVASFALFIWLAPVKPLWLALFMRR